jgi:hypothetical protein
VAPPQVDQYGEGFRVPTLVISPWAKPHFVDNTTYEFASLIKLADTIFNIPPTEPRVISANDMMNSFDFSQSPQPPLVEPTNVVGPVNSTSVACVRASVVVGVKSTCKATVYGLKFSPTGTVAWSTSGSGRFSARTCMLVGGSCSVVYTPTSASSPVVITAGYAGDKHNPSSSGAFSLAVLPRSTTTKVSCSPSSVEAGSSKTIKCTVQVKGYSPTGKVTWTQWTQSGTGWTQGGPFTLSSNVCTLSRGSCSITMTGTTAGTFTIMAAYNGDPNNTKGEATCVIIVN